MSGKAASWEAAIGFVLAVTGWWFILWLWVPLYSDMLRHIVITPIARYSWRSGSRPVVRSD